MQGYTNISPPEETKAVGDNILYGTAQTILLVLVRDADDVCKKVKLPAVVVPGLKRNIFSREAAAHKRVKTVTTKGGRLLGIGSFSVQLSSTDILDHRNLAIAR